MEMVNLVWGPRRRDHAIHVFIPSSYAGDAPHLREKTLRIGFLCRALAIFRVEELVIYHEDPKNPDLRGAELLKSIADYMNTAPYLRKTAFKLRKELRYVGLLPPLNIPTHPVSPEPPEDGYELREGRVVKMGPAYFVVAGLRKPIPLKSPMREGTKLILLTTRKGNRLKYRIVSKSKLKFYTGFRTKIHGGTLEELLKNYPIKIATSRNGTDVRKVMDKLVEEVRKKRGPICVAFGSYRMGLEEICGVIKKDVSELFDFVINLVPEQGVRSIRTEEAVYATLSVLNLSL